jgi:hypothetical protein
MKATIALLTLTIALCVSTASAQQCDPEKPLLDCWHLFNPPIVGTDEAVQERIATTNTAVPGMTLPNGTSLRDFLNFFAASVETATVTEGENAVTLDWNIPFAVNDKIKLQTIFTKPGISADLTEKLAAQSVPVTSLTDSLTETDDISASATYAPQNRVFGRSLEAHDELLSALVDSATSDEGEELLRLAQANFGVDVRGNAVTVATLMKDLTPVARAQFERSAIAEQRLAAAHQNVVDSLATLLNNQPQIYGTVVYHARDKLAGASEASAKVTYEIGANSLNSFLRKNRDRCGSIADIRNTQKEGLRLSTTCVGTMAAFARQPGSDTKARASTRLAVAVEYKQIRANRFELTEPVTIAIDTPHSHSLVYSVTLGIPVATTLENREGRFDVALNYDNVSNDATRKDRFVGSVTYTQKLTDTLTLPLSLVYANHANYLPDTHRKMGVHFGLNYKLPDLTP